MLILAMTGLVRDTDVEGSRRGWCDGHLTEPPDLRRLVVRLEEVAAERASG